MNDLMPYFERNVKENTWTAWYGGHEVGLLYCYGGVWFFSFDDGNPELSNVSRRVLILWVISTYV